MAASEQGGSEGEFDVVDEICRRWARERPDVDASPLQVLGRLHRCYVLYSASLSALLDEAGLNMASFDLLAALRRAGTPYRMSFGDLARGSLVSTAGISLRVDRLVASGHVSRDRDTNDRRIAFAQLTAMGLAVVDEVIATHFVNEERMLAGVNRSDRAALAGLLRQLERSLSTVVAPSPSTSP